MSSKRKTSTSKTKQAETKKKGFVKTRTRMDNSIEVEIQKSPSKTTIGRILIYLIVAGIALVPIIGLILAMIEANK